jgi:toxin ParE1/3/4
VKYCVIVSPEAENDLKEIFSWYEDNRIGLGYDFLLQIDAGINFVKRNPEIHPIEYKGTRKHLIKRFPYKIIYLVKEEEIIVLAVLHGKRSFELLKSRVDNA